MPKLIIGTLNSQLFVHHHVPLLKQYKKHILKLH